MTGEEKSTGTAAFSEKITAAQESIFWLTAMGLLFVFLGTNPLWGAEDRWAEAAREMLLSGDFLHPTLNWKNYDGQSVLHCWFILPFLKLLGNTETAVRFPSVLAALALLWGVRTLGRQLFDGRTALLGCWMTLGSYGFLFWGRMGGADMAGAAMAVLAGAWFFHDGKEQGFWSSLLFFLLCSAALLFRGLAAALTPAAVVMPWILSGQRWKIYCTWKTLSALLAAVALLFLFFQLPEALSAGKLSSVWSFRAAAGALRNPEMFGTVFTTSAEEPWYACFQGLLRLLLPWSPFLAVGAAGLFRRRNELSPRIRMTALGIVIALPLLICFSRGRWSDVLPLAPFVLLFCAAGLTRCGEPRWNSAAFGFMYYLTMTVSAIFIGTLIAYSLWEKLAGQAPDPIMAAAPVLAGAVAWGALFLDHREGSAFSRLIGLPHKTGAAVFAGVILFGCVMSMLVPLIQAEFRSEKTFFKELDSLAGKAGIRPSRILIYGGGLPEAYLYYNDLPSPLLQASSLAEAAAEIPGEEIIVILKGRERTRKQFAADTAARGIAVGEPLLSEKKHRWNSADSRGESYIAYIIKIPQKKDKKT